MKIIHVSNNSISQMESIFYDTIEKNVALFPGAREFVDKLVFTDEGSYETTIKSIDPNEGYTNTAELVGIGKTIAVNNSQSSIVLREELVDGFFRGGNKLFTELDSDSQLFAHTLFHEIGHAQDNSLRGTHTNQPSKIVQGYKVASFSPLYLFVLKGEFGACYNSSFLVNDRLLGLFQEQFVKHQESLISACRNGKNKDDLAKTFRTVVGNIWRIFTEYSKLCGYAGKRASYIQTSSPALTRLAETTQSMFLNYPNLDAEDADFVPIFLDYAHEIGFHFEITDLEDDAIYWL